MKSKKMLYITLFVIICLVIASIILTVKNKNEEVNISEAELKTYLSYIPKDFINSPKMGYQKDIELNKLDDMALVESTILYIDALGKRTPFKDTMDQFYYNRDDVADALLKIYNKKLENLNINYDNLDSEFYNYDKNQDAFYNVGSGGSVTDHISFIESYDVDGEKLIIHEYAALLIYNQSPTLVNYITGKETEIGVNEKPEDYLKDHKELFTKYEHVYQKSGKGYYWISTKEIK